jgi:hypothetical protein
LGVDGDREVMDGDVPIERDVVKGFPIDEDVPCGDVSQLLLSAIGFRVLAWRMLTTIQSDFTTSILGAVSKAMLLAVWAMLRRRSSSLSSLPGFVTAASFFTFLTSSSASRTRSEVGCRTMMAKDYRATG